MIARHKVVIGLLAILACAGSVHAQASVRIKDLTDLEGANSNHLVGVGLVVGLNGTGSKSTATAKMAVDMLQRFMFTSKFALDLKGDNQFKPGNVSMVTVTAELGPFARQGSRVEVTVSALDDATSLNNGVLIMTPLRGADLVDYVVAQGPVSVGGYSVSATGGVGTQANATATKNHPTVGRVANGPYVVREARSRLGCDGQLKFLLRDPDPATAKTIAKAINDQFPASAFPVDQGTVLVFIPNDRSLNLVSYIAELGMIEIMPEAPARVVINERTGTIVAGHQVKISTVAVTHGNLAIVTNNLPVASQPNPFARGKTVVLPRAQIGVTEQDGIMRVVEQTMTVGDLARALNALGAAPRDLIIIFQALKRLGALHAELVFM